MRITFQLRFHTNFGQELFVTGPHPILGNGRLAQAIPLQYVDARFWRATIELPDGSVPDTGLVYNYLLRNPDGSRVLDWGRDKVLNPASFPVEDLLVLDSWNSAAFYENAFYTEPFQHVLLAPGHSEVRMPAPARITHLFRVKAPLLERGQTLCLVGNRPSLGNWNTATPTLLNRTAGQDFLYVGLDLSHESLPLVYKYGVYDTVKNAFVRFEDGENRALNDTAGRDGLAIVNDGFAVLPSTTWKGAGVAIPVFSLRSEKSFGVGEFLDLKPFADWCKRTGLKLIQVLPVNDTTATHSWLDSYPYSAISAFALHPLYLNLEGATAPENQSLLAKLEPERKRLNALDTLDYEAVSKAKLAFLRKIYPLQKSETFETQEFKRFFTGNKHWLVPYAAFCCLRDKHGTADFNRWPSDRQCSPELLAALTSETSPAYDEVALNYFIQFLLHVQLREAAEYAHANGVILKGDIAIGVYRQGADVWQQPGLYHTDVQAGAPPDPFSDTGQNWSFPTYDWERMKQDGFAWWKRRFEQMSHYFDAFRVDHILGFFRIWSIPIHAVDGLLGYFVPAIPVSLEELLSRGIRFEPQRFLKPWITNEVLQEIFGADVLSGSRTIHDFLTRDSSGNLSLKPEFATQRQVEQHFAKLAETPENTRLKLGLYSLISNVILLEASTASPAAGRKPSGGAPELPRHFHFRFSMQNTSSFRHLDGHTQNQLKDLYIDYFFRRQDGFWMKKAMEKLPALKRSTNMLICGEDLGLVPSCVPEVMRQLGLLSLEIQRMPKDLGRQFSRPQDAPYLSVVTPSTHDMSTIRGWWTEDSGLTQKFFKQELGHPGPAPAECTPALNKALILQHLASPAMWSIFQLQDLLGMDEHLRRKDPHLERINVPANPKNYWRYRMHLSVETLLACDAFNTALKTEVQRNGR